MASKSDADKTAEKAEAAAKKVADEAQKGFESMADLMMMPRLDASAMGDFGRKNMDAMIEVGRILFDGAKNLTAKQIEVNRDMVQEFTNISTGVAKAKEGNAPGLGLDAFQAMSQKNMTSAREIADIAFQANQKAFAVLQKRFTDAVSELQGETE